MWMPSCWSPLRAVHQIDVVGPPFGSYSHQRRASQGYDLGAFRDRLGGATGALSPRADQHPMDARAGCLGRSRRAHPLPWPRPVVPVRSARHAPRPKMPRANSPSGRKPSTRPSKPRGNGRRPLSSRPSMPGGPGSRARSRRLSGGVAYDSVATSVTPKRVCSTSSPPPHSTWCASRRGWRTSPRATTRRSAFATLAA